MTGGCAALRSTMGHIDRLATAIQRRWRARRAARLWAAALIQRVWRGCRTRVHLKRERRAAQEAEVAVRPFARGGGGGGGALNGTVGRIVQRRRAEKEAIIAKYKRRRRAHTLWALPWAAAMLHMMGVRAVWKVYLRNEAARLVREAENRKSSWVAARWRGRVARRQNRVLVRRQLIQEYTERMKREGSALRLPDLQTLRVGDKCAIAAAGGGVVSWVLHGGRAG